MDTVTYADGTTEEVYGYDIPVEALDTDFQLALLGTKGKWYDHTVSVRNAEPKTEQAAETPADGAYTAAVVLEAVKAAKKYGTVVSYDLNYRASLWKGIGGQEKAQEVNKEIAKYIDVMIGNEEDFTACLGLEVEGNDKDLKSLNMDGYYKMIEAATKAYPNFKVIATTLRTVKTATVNDWKAICWADGQIYKSMEFPGLEILDRVGGGDSFASGLIYGLMTFGDAQQAVNTAWFTAHWL